ncbi:MAG TPA: hypothetical protein VJ866_05250 [Pyrinomonadaceae bacterium]|nr:hypothetical protein [Pyrinomonadaceae bacterium]
MATLAVKHLQLAPLGAGDLIDRTVRLYRRHFGALVRASAPPVVVSAVGTVLWSVSVRSLGVTTSEARLALYLLAALAGAGIYVLGLLAQLIVMGGASRNLVMHLLWDEPVTARLIYRSVRSRFRGLLGAAVVVFFWLLLASGASMAAGLLLMIPVTFLIVFLVGALVSAGVDWIAFLLVVLAWLGTILVMLYVFFLVAGRVAYVPQVLMVEGKGVLDAISRSAELARGNVRRLMGMFLFTGFAGFSAEMLLLVPHAWFGYLNGLEPIVPFFTNTMRMPTWYIVSYEVMGQFATILLAPVWMMGLSLLYVDERVRHEGYDIELLAAQVFGEMPAVPEGYRAPLAPAISAPQAKPARSATVEGKTAHAAAEEKPATVEKPPGSVLGL